jgi:hypothetical protein
VPDYDLDDLLSALSEVASSSDPDSDDDPDPNDDPDDDDSRDPNDGDSDPEQAEEGEQDDGTDDGDGGYSRRRKMMNCRPGQEHPGRRRAVALSPKTVDVHRGHIREKLGLKDVTALLRHAVQWLAAQNSGPEAVRCVIPDCLARGAQAKELGRATQRLVSSRDSAFLPPCRSTQRVSLIHGRSSGR